MNLLSVEERLLCKKMIYSHLDLLSSSLSSVIRAELYENIVVKRVTVIYSYE